MKLLICVITIIIMAAPVSAAEWTAPAPPNDAMALMPEESDTFWEGFREILRNVLPQIQPALSDCICVCLSILAVVFLVSFVQTLPGSTKHSCDLAGAVAIGTLLLRSSNSLIGFSAEAVQSLSEYGKLLLPVMTAALAGSGGTATSAALYAGTAVFDSILSTLVSAVIVPMTYVFLCLAVANSALGEDTLKKISAFVKWLMTWCLKLVLYIFTGYISITGVVSGATDAAAVKAAKLTISGMVPVVGNILSDASEAVLVGADVVRSAAGIYGMLAVLAIWIRPFLEIGAHYLLLKAAAAVCGIFGSKRSVELVKDFSSAMGLLLAMTGTGCLLLLVSLICFMKGVS